ncbi:MAG TPA: 16S rRNA (guanine(527)-N(7))-methyltransferase RsmG [Thermomicrobiaceae bacterium]|nr:16S rRNA (guanine(527)-N(7))-methyltransferase RsmG [Thermomicrobiaceae bacterium]
MPEFLVLRAVANTLGVPLEPDAVERFTRYRDLLLDWNRRVNLTRVTDPVEVEVRLFADALALYPFLQRQRMSHPVARPRRLIDVGSGGGFPGLPLKIVDPTLDVVLLEATGKKVTFLEAAIAELDLDGVRAVHGRAEEYAHQPAFRARFDLVTARGVARLPTLLEFCLPFLRPGGWGIFPKGRDAETEASDSARALETLGGQLVAVEPIPLPELSGSVIVAVEQASPAPSTYPRRAGLPVKRPL